MTVQDLIDMLRRLPRNAPVRFLESPGVLGGIAGVTTIAGRVVLRPSHTPRKAR